MKYNVNGTQFSVITNSDLDWRSTDVIYVISWEEKDRGMQYVGQTCRFLKSRFSEHYRRIKKPRTIDNFLYRHFKQTIHYTRYFYSGCWKIIYDDNSTKRYRNSLRHELELKWIKLLQKPHPLGFNDTIYHEGNISRLPDFDVFSLLDIRKRNNRSHGKRKNWNLKRNNKHVFTLLELSIILKHSGRQMALSRLVTLSISSLCNLDIEANKFYDRAHWLYDAALLTGCYTQHALWPYMDSKLIILGILSKLNLSTRGLNWLTYPVYLKINLLFLLFLLILKIRNPLSFVISIINLFVIQFLTITN